MRPFIPAVLTAALALALLGALALADRETATFLAARGDKALAAKKWDEAETHYRKALDEDATLLPARHGLAQALLGAGKSAQAIEELRGFVDSARAEAALPAEWKPLLAKAQKQLGEIDAAGAALQKIKDAYVGELVAIGERWSVNDPLVAERALRRALTLKPGAPKAAQILERMGKSAAGETVDLFDGKSLNGWTNASSPRFQVIDGELVGEVHDAAYVARSTREFTGDFDVRMEARLLEQLEVNALFALVPAWRGDYDHYAFGVFRGKIVWYEKLAKGKNRDILSLAPTELNREFDATKWNVYELKFRGAEVTAFVNGEEVGREPRPEARRSGFVGLQVQNVRVAFRKIQVDLR